MEIIIESLKSMFPHTTKADWFFAFLGLLAHAVIKLRAVPLKQFKWGIFFEEFISVWILAIISIVICLGVLPLYFNNYSLLDSVLIGYSSSSILRTLLKQKLSKLGINEDENKR